MKKNKAAQALGRLGAAARNKSMTPEERSKRARNAAKCRWMCQGCGKGKAVWVNNEQFGAKLCKLCLAKREK